MFLFLNPSPSLFKVGHRLPVTFPAPPLFFFFNAHVQGIPYQAQWIHSHSYESTAMKTLCRRIYGKFSSSYSSCHIGLKAVLILCRRSDISQSGFVVWFGFFKWK